MQTAPISPLDDAAARRRQYAEDGYCILPDFFQLGRIEQIYDDMMAVFARQLRRLGIAEQIESALELAALLQENSEIDQRGDILRRMAENLAVALFGAACTALLMLGDGLLKERFRRSRLTHLIPTGCPGIRLISGL